MSSENNNIKELIKRDIQGLLSTREVAYLQTQKRMYDPEEWDEIVADAVFELADSEYEPPGWPPVEEAEQVIQRINNQRQITHTRRLYFMRAAAAVVLALVGYWSLNSLLIHLERPEVNQVASCGELPSSNPLPLSEFGVSLSTKNPLIPRDEYFIFPGVAGLVKQQGEWNVLRDQTGRIILSRIQDSHKQTSLPVLEKWGFSNAVWQDWGMPTLTEMQGVFVFSTASEQQAEILMPGETTIRLNAGSSLRYTEDATIDLIGEGYVVQKGKPKDLERLPIETTNLQISSLSKTARYTLLTTAHSTQITLLEGTLHVKSKHTGREWTFKEKNHKFLFTFSALSEGGTSPEFMTPKPLPHYARPLAWTLPIRAYNQIKVKDYILEMARWYGVEVEGLECIENQFIQVRSCFRNPLGQFIHGLKEVGVEAQYVHGKLHLCKAHIGPPLAE